MRRKVAVFSGGWIGEFLQGALGGVIELAGKEDIDIFSFINFTIRGDAPGVNDGEMNIFRLPNICDFDGVLLFANTYNNPWELDYLLSQVRKYKVPTVCMEYPLDDITYITSNNYHGMYELAEHMVTCHGCKKFLYISGPEDHPEAAERLRAFMDVMAEKQVALDDDSIFYADWSKDMIPGILDTWFEKHNNYPEAIICANDVMAIATCAYLKEKNISIPEEVKVTGYDCIRLAQTVNPPLASVSHEWKPMGTKAMENLIILMNGGSLDKHTRLNNHFVPGGSCGCDIVIRAVGNNERVTKALTNKIIDPIDLDYHLRGFFTSVRKADNRDSVFQALSHLLEQEHLIEGDDFKLCLVPAFFECIKNLDDFPSEGYADEMEVICSLNDGIPQPYHSLPLNDCIFESANTKKEAGFYIFLPLYLDGKTYGFAMLTGPLNIANENQYYIWSRHMNIALDQVRNNMLITALWDTLMRQSVTDQLTGLYNRYGCEKIIYEDMIAHGREGGESILFLVDVDRMKQINDKHGHAIGDKALKLVTKAMADTLPEGLSPARFGGDEFLIGGRLTSSIDSAKIAADIENRLSVLVSECEINIPVSVSIGSYVCSPKDIADIEKAIVKADEDMYITKDKHHKKNI